MTKQQRVSAGAVKKQSSCFVLNFSNPLQVISLSTAWAGEGRCYPEESCLKATLGWKSSGVPLSLLGPQTLPCFRLEMRHWKPLKAELSLGPRS